MEISNSNFLWSTASLYSSSSTTSVSAGDTSFSDLLSQVGNNSLAQQMSEMGAESIGHPPDFAAMTTEEFREHLLEIQETLASNGVDISSFDDPNEMSISQLESLKEEMMSHGNNPPPPPEMIDTMDLMNLFALNIVDYSSDDMYSSLFDFL